MKCCINDKKFISLLLLSTELFKLEIQKYGQILCVHKPYFLMLGHISVMPITKWNMTYRQQIHTFTQSDYQYTSTACKVTRL